MSNDESGSSKTELKSTPKLEITEKLKVLCLHGYRQTGDGFKSKLGSFRKHVGKYADFVFATAPNVVIALTNEDEPVPDDDPQPSTSTNLEPSVSVNINPSTSKNPQVSEFVDSPDLATKKIKVVDQRSWWFNSDDEVSFKGTKKQGPAFKFEESLRHLEKIWEEEGPFQGILGFSQGACLAGILCGLGDKCYTTIKPKFAIMASGFLSGCLVHLKSLDDVTLDIPTLHIYGETDEIISKEMSEALIAKFENPQILTHPGGHYFPATAAQKQTYIYFFQDRLQEYLEGKELAKINEELFMKDNLTDGKDDDDDDIEDADDDDDKSDTSSNKSDSDSNSDDSDWDFS